MKALDALNALYEPASLQRGLITSAQARRLGVEKADLSRLAKNGHVERVAHGIYRMSAAPAPREGAVWVAWLSLDPAKFASERDHRTGVVSHNTASWLLDLGELNPEPLTFSHPARKQPRNRGIRVVRGELVPGDLTVVAGLPCTNAAKTVEDLVRSGEDLSLISSVLSDALSRGIVLDEEGLASRINSLGQRRGLSKRQLLYDLLRRG